MSVEFGGPRPNLDIRNSGSALFNAPANDKTKFYYTFEFDLYINGMEIYAWNSTPGDNIKIEFQYSPETGVWKRYKKFVKQFNIYPNTLQKYVYFQSEPKSGMRIEIEYDNKGENAVEFSLNAFQQVDLEKVDMDAVEEGEDW